ncbi:MAG TPA: CHY zinc finger protein [Candidatus Sulfotelmatobacter sp.]|jgi:uncharacterized CHY-type Zn-finger protein
MTASLPEVRGVGLDAQTRCAHYHSPADVVAIKMRCCGVYYACKDCHAELAHHPIEVWPESEWEQKAILCGACRSELSIFEYLQSGYRCPICGTDFNPRCQNHHRYYFAQRQ